ncbi:tetratricopeptide repeat protein, partial [Gemmatimonas aurantiaca]|nr:tetratricopeptide repeat protein [Gemmatimonas aurantiaca]
AECGTFSLASLGDERHRLEAEPLGELVNQVYRICDEAGTNQLLVGPKLAASLSAQNIALTKLNNLFILEPATNAESMVDTLSDTTNSLADAPAMLERYLPVDVTERLKTAAHGDQLQSEHRQAVAMFGYFLPEQRASANANDARKQTVELNATLVKMFEIIRNRGGSIARIDPYDTGHKLLILFGAPKKRDDDELRAIACARELLKLHCSEFRLRFGLALGSLYCGDVGAVKRREYTIMGGAANMAARLMSKAKWGYALLDARLRENLPDQVQTTELFFSLKGIEGQTPAYQLGKINDVGVSVALLGCRVGQDIHFNCLLEQWNSALAGAKTVVTISGESGIGKTHMIRHFVQEQTPRNSAIISCDNATLFGRGWLIIRTLQTLRGTHAKDVSALLQWCESVVGSRWRPILSAMLGQTFDDNEWTRGLTASLRESKSKELFSQLINKAVEQPYALFIDDFDKSDDLSRTLIISLVEEQCVAPLLLALVCRNNSAISSDNSQRILSVKLQPPTEDEWWEYFKLRFESGKREREFFSQLLTSSHGSPMVITDFVDRCRASGQLAINSVSGLLEQIKSETEFEFPESYVGAHLSRFDDLPERDRSILKKAAIVGGWFESAWLQDTTRNEEGKTLEVTLNQLVTSGPLVSDPEFGTYSFRQSSMREAIYSCLPNEERQRLHRSYAEHLLSNNSSLDPAIMAYHTYEAADYTHAFIYSLQAARATADAHALNDAAQNLRRCQAVIDHCGEETLEPEALFTFYALLAKSLGLAGRYHEVYNVFRRWRRLGRMHNNSHACITPALETAQTLWRQSKYGRSRKIITALLASRELRDNNRAYAAACSNMADIERRTGNFVEACVWCEKAISSAQDASDAATLSDAHNKLGLTLWGMGDLERATAEFTRSLEYGASVNGHHARARTVNNLGIIHYAQGHFVAAERGLTEALESFADIGDKRNEAYASGNLANISRHLGKFTHSQELFGRADLIFKRLNDSHAHHYTVGNLGDIDLICGDLKEAEKKFSQASAFAASVDDKELAAECEVRFGELAFFSGDIPTAETRYKSAIAGARTIGSKEWLMRGSIGLARLYIFQRDKKRAQRLIDEVTELAVQENAIIVKNEAVFLIGELGRISGNFETAARKFRDVLAYATKESLFELTLKAAVRLREIDPATRDEIDALLGETSEHFIATNTPSMWRRILQSAYFTSFARTFRDVFKEFDPSKSPTMMG